MTDRMLRTNLAPAGALSSEPGGGRFASLASTRRLPGTTRATGGPPRTAGRSGCARKRVALPAVGSAHGAGGRILLPAAGVRRLAVCLLALAVILAAIAPARAHELEPHHVVVQAGPYPVEVGFSEWPVLAERAIDITFMPDGGIAGKSATLALVRPGANEAAHRFGGELGRHPRQREYWGLDLIALPAEGEWTLTLTVDGAAGPGETSFTLPVGPRPGPPPLPMWLLGILPAVALVALVVAGWRRVHPGRTADAATWM